MKAAICEFGGQSADPKRGEGSGYVSVSEEASLTQGHSIGPSRTSLYFTDCSFNCFEPQFAHL